MSINLKRIKVFITGPTRSGTTFLLSLFHHMGFYTGYSDREVFAAKNKAVSAGLEYIMDRKAAGVYPYVIKHPASWIGGPSVFDIIDKYDLTVQHMIVTTREHEALVKSNVEFIRLQQGKKREDRSTQIEKEIRKTMPAVQSELFAKIEERETPYTVIEFPRMVQDREYLFDALKHIRKVTREKFDTAFDLMADKNKVHY